MESHRRTRCLVALWIHEVLLTLLTSVRARTQRVVVDTGISPTSRTIGGCVHRIRYRRSVAHYKTFF